MTKNLNNLILATQPKAIPASNSFAVPILSRLMSSVFADPGPCDGCANFGLCSQGLACDAFVLYARVMPKRKWQRAEKNPSVSSYMSVFGIDEFVIKAVVEKLSAEDNA